MLRSMTGFGRSSTKTPYGTLVVEIQAVNRKYLETAVWMSKDFFQFEVPIKKMVAKKIYRGYVTVRVQLFSDEKTLNTSLPEMELLKNLHGEWVKRAKELGVSEEISLEFLLEQSKEIEGKREKKFEDFLPFLKEGVSLTLENFCEMKISEGKALEKDISDRLEFVEKKLEKIKELSPKQVEVYREKLEAKLADFLQSNEDTKEILLREVVLFSDKVDISEELVRFDSHLKQFRDCVKSDEASKGKKLDFLLQEMNREVHTIGSKSSEVEISPLVIEIKVELEKIREQLQNVE